MASATVKTMVGGLAACCFPGAALSQEGAPGLDGAERCQAAGHIPAYALEFRRLKPDETETVGMVPTARLVAAEPFPGLPPRVYARDGETLTEWRLSEEGLVIGFESVADATEAVRLCAYDPGRAGTEPNVDRFRWQIETDIVYRNASGRHAMEEIEDGLRDGRKHYRQVAGVWSLVVPKMTHLMIRPRVPGAALSVAARRNGAALPPLEMGSFCGLPLLKVDELRDGGAEELVVEGGPYVLLPVPGPKALARFAGCGDEG